MVVLLQLLAREEGSEISLVSREVPLGWIIPGIFPESLMVSPDSKRVAYVAGRGGKLFVVVDGMEGKEYDGIVKGTPIFSPDSKRVAYAAERGGKRFVVVDGVEGKEYYGFLRGSKPTFESPKRFHGLAVRGRGIFRCGWEIFRVEIEIVER